MSRPLRVPADATFEEKATAAARHDPPPGARMIVTPETLESCAKAAERDGNRALAAWLRALAANQRRLETVAGERGYVMHYRRDRKGVVHRTRPYRDRRSPAKRARDARPRGARSSRGPACASTGPPQGASGDPPGPPRGRDAVDLRVVGVAAPDADALIQALANLALAHLRARGSSR